MTKDIGSEIWKDISGWSKSYQVSNLGRVRSKNRTIIFSDGRVRKYRGKLCGLKISFFGYPLASLNAGKKCKKWVVVHRLVMQNFIGNRPINTEICHNDGNKRNNILSNLRYDTRVNNMSDKIKHGTHLFGNSHPSREYTKRFLLKIKKQNGTITEISNKFGVSRTHVWNIKNGKRRPDLQKCYSK